MLEIFDLIKRASVSNAPFFIHGETGTGKELCAHAIHHEGQNCEGEFVAINCANFNEQLLESQLFGHVRGAFTGAVRDQMGILQRADRGTLFLDEITEMPLQLQAKFLRVLQEREFFP